MKMMKNNQNNCIKVTNLTKKIYSKIMKWKQNHKKKYFKIKRYIQIQRKIKFKMRFLKTKVIIKSYKKKEIKGINKM